MDAVALMGKIIKQASEATKDNHCFGAAKIVVFCNAVEDNPFMAGAFHGVGEPDCAINVGVSGPGVVRAAIKKAKDTDNITEIADIIKKTVEGRPEIAVPASLLQLHDDVELYLDEAAASKLS